jgi:isoamyl acetate esterase
MQRVSIMKIVCFGDSLTRGVSYLKGRLRILKKNYPAVLQELFKNNGAHEAGPHIEVLNKGVFNDNSNLLLSRLERDVTNEKPDFAIISIGGNDCNFSWEEVAQNPGSEHIASVPLDKYADNLRCMIEKVRDSGITPILLTLPPLDPVRYYENISNKFSSQISGWICRVGGIEHWHGKYNQSLNKIADELNVLKIDVRSALKQAGDLADLISADGIHLTEWGYKILGAEIYDYLATFMQSGNMDNMRLTSVTEK